MHLLLVGLGIVIVLMIAVHILFRVIKFTLSVFLLGILLLATLYVFQVYFGIDLVAVIARHL